MLNIYCTHSIIKIKYKNNFSREKSIKDWKLTFCFRVKIMELTISHSHSNFVFSKFQPANTRPKIRFEREKNACITQPQNTAVKKFLSELVSV